MDEETIGKNEETIKENEEIWEEDKNVLNNSIGEMNTQKKGEVRRT